VLGLISVDRRRGEQLFDTNGLIVRLLCD
jgi:hypothetical protein